MLLLVKKWSWLKNEVYKVSYYYYTFTFDNEGSCQALFNFSAITCHWTVQQNEKALHGTTTYDREIEIREDLWRRNFDIHLFIMLNDMSNCQNYVYRINVCFICMYCRFLSVWHENVNEFNYKFKKEWSISILPCNWYVKQPR